MKVGVIGTGYVGLVAGACFADNGNEVICVDVNEAKVQALKNGEIPIYEPGLDSIVERNTKNGRLSFTTSTEEGVQKSDVIFIAVGTPQGEDGSADLSRVLQVAESIGKHINAYKVIVDKSTVPVGTAEKVRAAISKHTSQEFDVVSNPEFLKEGAAIDDFMKPDRVVIGANNEKSAKIMQELYAPFVRNNNPILVMDVVSAELTKYAANAMLATRISFMNEIANLCEKTGANIDHIRKGIGTDSRIGMSFLYSGIGYGGSCFPKDVQAIVKTALDYDYDFKLGQATEAVNKLQKSKLAKQVSEFYDTKGESLNGKKFAMWGLAFKPQTDDVREAPALSVCKALIEKGATVVAYDPEAIETFKVEFGSNDRMFYAKSEYDAINGADALIVCTEWGQFRVPNFDKIKSELKEPVIFDGRNIFKPKLMKEKGFVYYSIGRVPVLQDS